MEMLSESFLYTLAGLIGAIVGSFLNVCIVRLPKGESIVSPRSHCPRCHRQLSWWENIPLVSFGILRARCRHCKQPISWRYPLVEVIAIAFSLLMWWRFHDPLPYFFFFLLFLAPLIVISFIDMEHLIIPDAISISGIVVGLGSHLFFPGLGGRLSSFGDGVIGAVVGGGFLFLVAWGYEKLKKQEGLGGGDVKLAAMLGAFFGWRAALFMLMVSSVLGSLVGIVCVIVLRKGLKYVIPFGPFLALAGVIQFFFGDVAIRWYLHFFS